MIFVRLIVSLVQEQQRFETCSPKHARWLKDSGLDAWSGFNQVAVSERAKRLLKIITSLGARQWTVLPFGVTNGLSYFQEFMHHLFDGGSAIDRDSLPSLLGTEMDDPKALLEIWIDDIQCGTCEVYDQSEESGEGFDRHVESLDRILERASAADLRFKLSECNFAQYSLDTVRMVAGMWALSNLTQRNPKG